MHRDDPAAMSIDGRLDEAAPLLAGGFLRLKRRTGGLATSNALAAPRACRVIAVNGCPQRVYGVSAAEGGALGSWP